MYFICHVISDFDNHIQVKRKTQPRKERRVKVDGKYVEKESTEAFFGSVPSKARVSLLLFGFLFQVWY